MSEMPASDYIKIRHAIENTGRKLRMSMYVQDDEMLEYQGDNAAGHKSLGIDLYAERLIVENLEEAGISGKLISEENGEIMLKDQSDYKYTFILDPLDGSTNFRRGIPFSCIAMAINLGTEDFYYDKLRYGIVYDFHSRHFYEIIDGEIAVDGRKIKRKNSIKPTAVSFYNYGRNKVKNLMNFDKNSRIRTLGCAALELILVALGGLDAFIDIRGGLGTYDFAVSAKFIEILGGKIIFLTNNTNEIISGNKIKLNDVESGYRLIATFDDELLNTIMMDLFPELIDN